MCPHKWDKSAASLTQAHVVRCATAVMSRCSLGQQVLFFFILLLLQDIRFCHLFFHSKVSFIWITLRRYVFLMFTHHTFGAMWLAREGNPLIKWILKWPRTKIHVNNSLAGKAFSDKTTENTKKHSTPAHQQTKPVYLELSKHAVMYTALQGPGR